ncbi:hypothetical protein BJV74DRAFT_18571 [Russula compacta]|nr:hypothetical protein BJV74DRAFT_18571 [Russula compacta]
MDAWVIFRRARIVLLACLVLFSLTWAVLFTVFLGRGGSDFSLLQKIEVISWLSLYGFTAIFLYLMVVVHFHLWRDVLRVFALLAVHTGSSVLFMLYRYTFPCRGFSTETACRDYVNTILIGGWVFSGIILCFAIALGIMAFVPKPVEYLSGSEGFPPLLKPANPLHERQPISPFPTGSRTGPTVPKDLNQLPEGSLSPDLHSAPVNGTLQETVAHQPPRVLQSPQSLDHSSDMSTYDGTILMRNAPRENATTSFEDGPNRSYAFPKPMHSALSPIPFSDPPPLATMQRVHARTATSRTYSLHSTAASVHSNWVPSTPHTPHTPALNPGPERFRRPSAPSASWGLEGPPLVGSLSPNAVTAPIGRGTAHPRDTSAVEQRPFPRTDSDGQVLDRKQWRRLVLSAAAGP